MEDRSPVTPTSPIPFVEQIGQVYVVREDLIPEYVYAATAYGGAQIALALAAKQMNKRVTLFVAKRKILHPRTQAAQDAGAQIIGVPMGFLSVVYARARAYCQTTGACLLPLGFDSEEALEAIASTAGAQTIWTIR